MPLSAIQPERYDALLDSKLTEVAPRFAPFFAGKPKVVRSSPSGFRLRAEFRIWHESDDLNYVMFRRGAPKQPIPIEHFPIASPKIQQLMPRLLERLRSSGSLRKKLFQVEFLSTLEGDTAITLIYHRALDGDWEAAARSLSETLDVSIIGRSRKQKIVVGRDWVQETLNCNGRQYRYQQPEQAFTQPNARVNEQMLDWACEQAAGIGGDLLELYCGIGNFTLPLATHFDHVIATELSKVATRAAEQNRQTNHIDNVEFARLSAEEMAEAMDGVRPFRRLANLRQPLTDYALRSLFVDPPRAGLDPATLSLAKRFDNVFYISCNPDTLLENLATLNSTHEVHALAFFDQFPYTHHLECGVILQKR